MSQSLFEHASKSLYIVAWGLHCKNFGEWQSGRLRLPVEQDCKKRVGSNPTSPSMKLTK